jgi:hypothetical protein
MDFLDFLRSHQCFDVMQHTAAAKLNASCPAVKSYGNIASIDNDRNLSPASGMFKHIIHIYGIRKNIDILNLLSLFCKGFTGPVGIRSGAFSINKYFIRHGILLFKLALPDNSGKFIRYRFYCQSEKMLNHSLTCRVSHGRNFFNTAHP